MLIIEIPFGYHEAPFFSLYYESKSIKKVRKRNDGLIALSSGEEAKRNFKEIYPLEIIIEKENLNNNEG